MSLIPTLLLVGSTYNTPESTFNIPVTAIVSPDELPKLEFPLAVRFPVMVAFPPIDRFASRVVFHVTSRVPGISTVVPVSRPSCPNAEDVCIAKFVASSAQFGSPACG